MSDSDFAGLEALLKGGKKAELGEVRTWASVRYIKRADGWEYMEGPNKGKLMGGVRASKKKEKSTPKIESNEKKEVVETVEGYHTDLLESALVSKGTGRVARIRGLATGKPSKVPFKKIYKTKTNLIGQVAFGKTTIANQNRLNESLNSADLILDELGVTLKQSIDFTCQTLKGKNLYAVYQPLKGSYEANDRIDIKASGDLNKSILHEIGHAIDFSIGEGPVSSFFKDQRYQSNRGKLDTDTTKDVNRLIELLKEAPFYTDRSDKGYLAKPTEVFARAFEVLAFDTAMKLRDKGELTSEFVDGFHPDFLKVSTKGKTYETTNDLIMDLNPEMADEFERLTNERSEMLNKVNTVMREKSLNKNDGFKEAGISYEDYIAISNKIGKIYMDTKLKAKAIQEAKRGARRADSDEVRTEIADIMRRVLKTNKIQKAMRNLDLNLRKSEVESAFYSAIVVCNPYSKQVLLGKRLEDGIWTSPAGGSDPGESPEDCAVRECWEEAQIAVDKSKLIPLKVVVADNGKPVHVFMYHVIDDKTSILSDPDKEVAKWEWFRAAELPKEMRSEKNKSRLDSVNAAFIKMNENQNMNKSVTNIGIDGTTEIDTSKFAQEAAHVDPKWLKTFYDGMEGFQYGDLPREFQLDQGTLILSKVEDGLYTGFFKKEEGDLVDGSGMRIERQSIPTLVSFLTAKEWIRPESKTEVDKDQEFQALDELLSLPEPPESTETEPKSETLRVLELLEKLLAR